MTTATTSRKKSGKQLEDRINLFFIWGNEAALAIAPICEGRKFPCVLMAQHPKAGAGYRYAIRFINPADDQTQTAAVRYPGGLSVAPAVRGFLSAGP